MARAILALPTIFECHNGLSHSGTAIYAIIFECHNGSNHSSTQIMHPAVPEWLGPFWHSNHASGRARMARAILALKLCNWPCQNGSNHTYTLAVSEWLELFWHSSHVCNLHGCARKARAILAQPTIFECHNGLSHSGTQVMQLAVPEWHEPFLHASNATGRTCMSARMARAILAQPCRLHDLSARIVQAILAWPVA